MAKTQELEPQRPFGIFYPRGHVVVALPTAEAAGRMRGSLLEGGCADDDIRILDTQAVLEGASADLQQLNPLVWALGSEASVTEGGRRGRSRGSFAQFL